MRGGKVNEKRSSVRNVPVRTSVIIATKDALQDLPSDKYKQDLFTTKQNDGKKNAIVISLRKKNHFVRPRIETKQTDDDTSDVYTGTSSIFYPSKLPSIRSAKEKVELGYASSKSKQSATSALVHKSLNKMSSHKSLASLQKNKMVMPGRARFN